MFKKCSIDIDVAFLVLANTHLITKSEKENNINEIQDEDEWLKQAPEKAFRVKKKSPARLWAAGLL